MIKPLSGAGLGLKRDMLNAVIDSPPAVDFFEIAPENWIGIGGKWGQQLTEITERTPLACHGLSLSLGSTDPLDQSLLEELNHFFTEFNVALYSEHLSYCSHQGHLYDLLPLPFTEEAVKHVSQRIRQVQDQLSRKISVENVSYYVAPEQTMTEVEFINAVLHEADCELLLDVNNIYVNSQNHGYDPHDFLQQIDASRISYYHIAGHYREDDGFIIDTHGSDVIDPVWSLLNKVYQQFGVKPTLLERDFNIPTLDSLMREVNDIKQRQAAAQHLTATIQKQGR